MQNEEETEEAKRQAWISMHALGLSVIEIQKAGLETIRLVEGDVKAAQAMTDGGVLLNQHGRFYLIGDLVSNKGARR
jgi:hypothetical protein